MKFKFTSEYNRLNKKKYNTYTFDGEVGCCYSTNNDKLFIFDTEDYDKIKDICWSKDIRGYASGRISGSNKFAQAHRLILNISQESSDSIWIDHINRDPLDNRKSNLRIADKSQNRMNSSIRLDNTSGITGVYARKNSQKWSSVITKNKQTIYLGTFKSKKEAIIARLLAEKEYFGEFAPQKHLFEEYGI